MSEMTAPIASKWWRFSVSHLLWFTLAIALALGWWLDRRRLASRIDLFQIQVERLQSSLEESRHSVGVVPAQRFSRFASGGDFLEVLQPAVDWYEFQDELALFAKSPIAANAIPLVIQRLDDADPEVRTRALATLGSFKLRPAEVVPLVTARLDDPFPNAAWHAAAALGEFGRDAKSAVRALEAKFRDDNSPIATHCGLMLVRIDPSISIGPRLIELTQSPIRENRWRAIQALPDYVEFGAMQPVLAEQFAREDDEEIRTMIADSLNRKRK